MQFSLSQFGHLSAIPRFSNCDVFVGTTPSGEKLETGRLFPSRFEIFCIISFANLHSASNLGHFEQMPLHESTSKLSVLEYDFRQEDLS